MAMHECIVWFRIKLWISISAQNAWRSCSSHSWSLSRVLKGQCLLNLCDHAIVLHNVTLNSDRDLWPCSRWVLCCQFWFSFLVSILPRFHLVSSSLPDQLYISLYCKTWNAPILMLPIIKECTHSQLNKPNTWA